jgi:predicted outer membrane repeat protein
MHLILYRYFLVQEHGGVGYIVIDSIATLLRCSFSANSAGLNGGVMHAQHSTIVESNSEYSTNSADEGGCISLEKATLYLTGSTFTKNVAETNGGAIVLSSGSTLVSKGNVFTSNAV